MSDRPEEFRYESGYGVVDHSYDSWHVDIRTVDGGLIRRAIVLGHRLPEASTVARPQWVQYAFAAHDHSMAFCTPVNSRMPGDRTDRSTFVYYDEVANYRITVDRAGVFEIRNTKDGRLLQIRITEDGDLVELRTPGTYVHLDDPAEAVTVDAPHIYLGAGAIERLVLGEQLLAYVNVIVGIFNAHKHSADGNPPYVTGTPPFVPQPVFPESALSPVSKTL